MISANQIQTAATKQNDLTVRAAVDAVNGFTIAIALAAPAVAVAAIGYGAYKIWNRRGSGDRLGNRTGVDRSLRLR